MRKKFSKAAILPIVAMLFLGLLPMIPAAKAQSTEIYFDPSNYIFDTSTATVDDLFNVTIWVKGMDDMKTWQLKFYYDDDIINVTRWYEPTWDSEYVFYSKTTLPVPAPPGVAYGHDAPGVGWVGVGSALFPAPSAGNGFTGDGLLCIITFEIKDIPDKTELLFECDLDFEPTTAGTFWIKAGETTKRAFDVYTDGYYKVSWVLPPNARMAVRPNYVEFSPWDNATCNKFNVTIYAENLDAAWGATNVSFCLQFNTSLIDIQDYWVDDLWTNSSGNSKVVITHDVPWDMICVNVTDPATTPSGNVALIIIEFHVVYQGTVPPRTPLDYDETPLFFCSYKIMNHVQVIPTDPPVEGTVRIYCYMALPLPYLEVVPSEVVYGPNPSVCEEFEVEVVIRNLRSEWYLVAYQFRLTFDDTLLDGVSCEVGPFLKDSRWNLYGTIDISRFDPPVDSIAASAVVGSKLWPNMTTKDYSEWTIFPQAEGPDVPPLDPPADPVVATIRFHIKKQLVAWPPINLTCALGIMDTTSGDRFFFDKDDNLIPPGAHLNGEYKIISTWTSGKAIDVYGGVIDMNGHGACPYPAPYGGQGQGEPMDMVWPQKEVRLYANVTYNFWPVQDKAVTFRITGPLDGSVNFTYIDTAVTDKDGVAMITFRMPWQGCSDPESYFGVYEVTAYVDIYCECVCDTLWFHYDYAVNIFKVTTEKKYYEHCNTVKITVEYGSYAMQKLFPTRFVVTIKDEVGQPIGYDVQTFVVGGADWCQYKNGTLEFYIHIPKWAAAGFATVHVSCICDIHLCPWYPPYEPTPEISILPK